MVTQYHEHHIPDVCFRCQLVELSSADLQESLDPSLCSCSSLQSRLAADEQVRGKELSPLLC